MIFAITAGRKNRKSFGDFFAGRKRQKGLSLRAETWYNMTNHMTEVTL